jgi:hypothetical protein
MRRGHYYATDVPTPPPTLGLVVGGVWHRLLEDHFRTRSEHDELDVAPAHSLELVNYMRQTAEIQMVKAEAEGISYAEGESLEQGIGWLHVMIGTFCFDPPTRWDGKAITAVEAEIRADLGSPHHTIHGYLDLVVDDDEHGPVGVDHKSAGKPWRGAKAEGDPRRLIQAPLYAEAWTRITGQQMNWFAYDVMTYGGLFDRVWVDVSPEIRAPFVERWVQMSHLIHVYTEAGLTPPVNPSSFLCSSKYCPWWEVCPAGAGLDASRQGLRQISVTNQEV